jgi:hypothetical protein
MPDDWSHEETDDPGFADRRNSHRAKQMHLMLLCCDDRAKR